MRSLPLFVVLPMLMGADWPQHLGAKRDSQSPETIATQAFPKNGPKVLWKYDVGPGWSGPVAVGGKVLIYHRVDNQEVLALLDSKTGKEVWKATAKTKYRDDFNFDEGPRATPLVHNDSIYTLGADGSLSAWEFKTGKQIWTKNINDDYQVEKGFFGVATSPIIVQDRLLINVGVKGAGVVAFEPKTGKELWRAGNDAVSYSSPVVAEIDGVEMAIFFTRAGLLALTPEKGEIKYTHPWRPRINASVNAATPIVSANQIFLTTSYGTGAIALKANKGKLEEVWSGDKMISAHFNTPVLIAGKLYGIDGRQEGGAQLRCVDWLTGKVEWSEKGYGCSGLIAAKNALIATTESGEIVLIDPNAKGYKELARGPGLTAPVRALPALSDGLLFVRDGKKLVAIDLRKE